MTCFQGSWSLSRILEVLVPDMDHRPLTSLGKKFCIFKIPPDCGSLPGSSACGLVLFWWCHVSASPISMLPFYPLLWKLCSSCFQVFFRGDYVIVGGSELGTFLCSHLELFSPISNSLVGTFVEDCFSVSWNYLKD